MQAPRPLQVMHVPHEVPLGEAPQAPAVHIWHVPQAVPLATGRQLPVALHAMHAPQEVPAGSYAQAPAPLQLPVKQLPKLPHWWLTSVPAFSLVQLPP